jgi:hypothetical protein
MSISIFPKLPRLFVAGGALAATLLGAPFAVHAEKNVKAPGTICSPIKGDVSKINYTNTSVVNESTSSAKVMCPVILQSDNVNKPSNMFTRVIDRSTSADVKCRVYRFAYEVGQVWQSAEASSHGIVSPSDGSILQDIDPDGSGDGIILHDDAAPGFVLSMTCTLPGASSSSTRSEIVNFQMGQGT